MSVSEESSSRRKHITSACVSCRESKIKCDGVLPTCASCRSKGKECQYQAGEDKRRLSHRMAIELLSDRIDELYRFIQDSSLEPPAMDKEKQASLMKVLGYLRLSSAVSGKDGLFTSRQRRSSCSDCAPEYVPESQNAVSVPVSRLDNGSCGRVDLQGSAPSTEGEHPPDSWTNTLSASDMDTLMHAGEMSTSTQLSPEDHVEGPGQGSYTGWELPNLDIPLLEPPGLMSLDALNPVLRDSDKAGHSQAPWRTGDVDRDFDNTETLVKQLSDRIGSLCIGAGGQVRYHGPTSNFNLVDMGPPDNLTVHRSVRDHGPDYLNRLDMGKEVPSELEDHLINLYFAWQDPAFHVVKRGMYLTAKVRWRNVAEDTPYFSEALENAMCSLGAAFEARHHPTFTTFPKSLADFFADRAKTLLEIELDSPSIATVQALVLLSSHDIGCKRDSRGWLYSGMATRLVFHLALHLDVTSYVISKSLSAEEADLRRDVFWAAYTVDHICSFHLGRPSSTNMESVTISPPDVEKSVDAVGQWIPYVSPRSFEEQTPVPDYTVALHRQRVLLCETMSPLIFALYGSVKTSSTTLHELNITTVSKLLAWKASLPAVLHVNMDDYETEYLPHVLLLHMLYHQNVIYAHRPWMSRSTTSSETNHGVRHDPEHARSMCIDAALSIAKLLQLYESRYGLRRVNIQAVGITCSAALLLIFAVVVNHRPEGAPTDATAPAVYLSTCFRALDEFGAAWESAKQARNFLTLLQRRWELQARRVRDARDTRDSQSPVFPEAGRVVPNKRPRTEDGQAMKPGFRNTRPGPQAAEHILDVDVIGEHAWLFMGGSTALGYGYQQGP